MGMEGLRPLALASFSHGAASRVASSDIKCGLRASRRTVVKNYKRSRRQAACHHRRQHEFFFKKLKTVPKL